MINDAAPCHVSQVDAFLPMAAAAMGSLSQMSSPAGDGKQRPTPRPMAAQDWFDPELDGSLSPILTPSLRHQLRAWMASRSPASSARAAGGASVTPTANRANLLGFSSALAAASSNLSAVSSTLSSAIAARTPGQR